jgi:hypothetical protein
MPRHGSQHTEQEIANAVESYRRGETTLVKMCARYHVRADRVKAWLQDAGVEIRPQAQAKVIPGLEDAIERYKAGESAMRLAKELGVGYETFRSRLVKEGVTIRNQIQEGQKKRTTASLPPLSHCGCGCGQRNSEKRRYVEGHYPPAVSAKLEAHRASIRMPDVVESVEEHRERSDVRPARAYMTSEYGSPLMLPNAA